MEIVIELEHFSHLHTLILKEQLDYNGEEVVCSCCEESISGPCYSCLSCYFFLHKRCGELPQEIKSHFHTQHPLLLLAEPSYNSGASVCNKCNKTGNSFVYHCSLCNFDLDTKCAFPSCLSEIDSQDHQFVCLFPSVSLKLGTSFTCNACGSDGDDSPYMCPMCLLMVHKDCIALPQTTRITVHDSQIVHTYFLGQGRSVKQYCGICREEVKAGFGGYDCPDCDFVAHVGCVQTYMSTTRSKHKEEEELESAFHIVREIKQGREVVILEIKHFSHEHNLILMNEVNHDLKCDGCMLPISRPYYSCADCNFLLDKSCIELPREKRFNSQTHLMTLISKACSDDGVFVCDICQQYCHGFSYRCECEMTFDVRCINRVQDFFEHEGHEHPLYLVFNTEEDYRCNACGVVGNSMSFKCTDCGFSLDFRCATLPHNVWHKYDDHPLFLTYVDPNTYQFYCQICEKERDPELWFYRCEECDFDAHTECAMGINPYIKFGDTYTYSIHSHPLALVEKIEDSPTCRTCGEPCNDLALECTDSHCDFIIHRKNLSCMCLSDADGEVE